MSFLTSLIRRINSGNAGITIRSGTTSNGCIFFSDATSGDAEFDGFVQYNHGTDPFMQFGVGDDTRMVIKGANVGIGTTSPSQKLDVTGNIFASSGSQIQITGTASSKGLQLTGQDDGTSLIGTMPREGLSQRK